MFFNFVELKIVRSSQKWLSFICASLIFWMRICVAQICAIVHFFANSNIGATTKWGPDTCTTTNGIASLTATNFHFINESTNNLRIIYELSTNINLRIYNLLIYEFSSTNFHLLSWIKMHYCQLCACQSYPNIPK